MLSNRFRRLRSLIGWLGLLGGTAACLLGLSAFLAPDYWPADNMSFFLRQFLAGGAGGLIGGLVGLTVIHRRPHLYKALAAFQFALLLLLCGFTVWRTVEYAQPATASVSGEKTVRIISTNLERLFLEDPKLVSFLKKADPDVMVFAETAWWLQKRYWQRLGTPIGAAGKAPFPEHMFVGALGDLSVYSKYPIIAQKTVVVESAEGMPRHDLHEIVVLTLDIEGRHVNVVAVHPASPRSETRWTNRQGYLKKLDEVVGKLQRSSDSETVVIGDWNLSPWSSHFGRFLESQNLHTAFPASIPQTTRFFFDYRLHWILGAVVDHVALSEGLHFKDVDLGPDIGSDHLPLIADIALPANEAERN